MNPAKVKAIFEWPALTNLRQLQRFLSFAKFYRMFIRNYSSLAAPLVAIPSTSTPFHWTPEAEAAFVELKHHFVSAPTVIQPDPARQFIVEVAASDTGVGAVLSQKSSDNKLHPCAFFSRRLSPAERNYLAKATENFLP